MLSQNEHNLLAVHCSVLYTTRRVYGETSRTINDRCRGSIAQGLGLDVPGSQASQRRVHSGEMPLTGLSYSPFLGYNRLLVLV